MQFAGGSSSTLHSIKTASFFLNMYKLCDISPAANLHIHKWANQFFSTTSKTVFSYFLVVFISFELHSMRINLDWDGHSETWRPHLFTRKLTSLCNTHFNHKGAINDQKCSWLALEISVKVHKLQQFILITKTTLLSAPVCVIMSNHLYLIRECCFCHWH